MSRLLLRIPPFCAKLPSLHDKPRKKHPQTSLESAEEVCRGCLPANGEISPDKLFDLWTVQIQALESWARGCGAIISAESLPALQERTNEHLVAFREADTRWVKVTKPRRFGFIADTDFALDKATQRWGGHIILREALPSEYLARLRLQNDIFEDAIQLEGVVFWPEQTLSLVISQPDITGSPSTLDEIRSSLDALGFREIPELHLGYTTSLSFYRASDRMAVFDAHPANSVTSQGTVFPIDFILQQATDLMHEEIQRRL